MKIATTIVLAVLAAATSASQAQPQTCIGDCGGTYRHDLFVERQYQQFLRNRYLNSGPRFAPGTDINIDAGVTLGPPLGTINELRSRRRQTVLSGGNAHARWCHDRYRSYRSSDNTFQPFDGPRRACNSPYN
ncbi:BA14K family protein [Ensifer aridi]|uniref:BA14K family protein n=1 Tax=Ensifer aridi TaxID=1708715 RepID=UPI000478C402|nr:BA14K family protein [Ensifer aridi]